MATDSAAVRGNRVFAITITVESMDSEFLDAETNETRRGSTDLISPFFNRRAAYRLSEMIFGYSGMVPPRP
jgi:hypothetical protein